MRTPESIQFRHHDEDGVLHRWGEEHLRLKSSEKTQAAECRSRRPGSRQTGPADVKKIPWLKLSPEAAKNCSNYRAYDGGIRHLTQKTRAKDAIQFLVSQHMTLKRVRGGGRSSEEEKKEVRERECGRASNRSPAYPLAAHSTPPPDFHPLPQGGQQLQLFYCPSERAQGCLQMVVRSLEIIRWVIYCRSKQSNFVPLTAALEAL